MQKTKINKPHSFKAAVKSSVIATSIALTTFPTFGAVNFEASVESDLIYQNIDSNRLGNNDVFSLQLKPVVGAQVETKSLKGHWIGSVTHLQREGSSAPDSDTFPEYEYNLNWEAIENFLTFSGAGNLQYRNVSAGDFLIADKLNSDDNLVSAQTDRFGARLTLLQGDWFRSVASISYGETDADDSSLFRDFAVDSKNYNARGRLYNGDEAKRLYWEAKGSYNKTERSSRGLDDFISRDASAFADTLVYGNWGVRLTGYHEQNEVSENRAALNDRDEFSSVGAGVVYRQSSNRYIALTVNESISDDPNIDGEQFVGADLKWAFSPRTSVDLDLGKNNYGRRASAAVNYQTKYTSASLVYHDRVTNTTRLLTESTPIGIYVCPLDIGTLAGCDAQDDLSYIPVEGEQVIPILEENFSLDDSVILRESLIATVGYEKGKMTLNVSFQVSDEESLGRQLSRETDAVSVESRYRLNRNLYFINNLAYAISTQRSPTLTDGETKNLSIHTGFDKYLNPRLLFQSYLTFLDKNGNYGSGRYGSDYRDIRLSVGVRYMFD
ncbi:hypothetical protein OPS25_01825 [Alteromonas ponticola]|uniref:TIGR03016 family PEP-CTERM system-associated outer membrane protein n=1 Tax=Alteromonas aquimaris TaxID=2998417 RepID=A0ABT3P3A4_9ALTE|nr:hypothetical protein [Alteromonas aquimaris]MCW8107242.1 hypothetical protein [Alteromonas aquimaris]